MNIEKIYTIKELARDLGVAEGTIRGRFSENKDKFEEGVDYIPGKVGRWAAKYGNITKFTQQGACKLAVLLTRKHGKQEVLHFLDRYCHNAEYVIREIKDQYYYLNIIKHAMKGFIEFREEYWVEDGEDYHKIDFYLPELRIAIECDEPHHKNKEDNDLKRQVRIEKLMNCDFIRFNPADRDINQMIGDIINILFARIHGIDKQDISPRLEKYKRWNKETIEAEKERIELERKEMEDAL